MQKVEAKSQGEKQNTYLKISHLTREKQALFDGPSKHRKKKSALKTSSPSKRRLSKKEYLHIKLLGWISTQFVEQKRITATSGPLSGSAISMLSEEFDW